MEMYLLFGRDPQWKTCCLEEMCNGILFGKDRLLLQLVAWNLLFAKDPHSKEKFLIKKEVSIHISRNAVQASKKNRWAMLSIKRPRNETKETTCRYSMQSRTEYVTYYRFFQFISTTKFMNFRQIHEFSFEYARVKEFKPSVHIHIHHVWKTCVRRFNPFLSVNPDL